MKHKREREKREKRQEKAERRAQRKKAKEEAPPPEMDDPDVDPDIAHIRPGPQPIADDE